MINWRMMICDVISFIFRSWSPIVSKLFLWFSVSEPPQFHICWFGGFFDNGFVCGSHRCLIICLNWCLRFWLPHFYECMAQWYHLFRRDKQCCHLCLCCRRHYCFDYFCNCQDRTIDCLSTEHAVKEYICACPDSRSLFVKKPSICVRRQYHITFSEEDAIIGLSSHIIKKLFNCCCCLFCCCCLLGTNCAQCYKEFLIDSSSYI